MVQKFNEWLKRVMTGTDKDLLPVVNEVEAEPGGEVVLDEEDGTEKLNMSEKTAVDGGVI